MERRMGWRSFAIMADRIIDSDFKLREWLQALGVQQTDLAEKAGVNEGYISQLVSGEKQNPSPKMVKKLATALNLRRPILLWSLPPKGLKQGKFDSEGLAALLDAHLHPDEAR